MLGLGLGWMLVRFRELIPTKTINRKDPEQGGDAESLKLREAKPKEELEQPVQVPQESQFRGLGQVLSGVPGHHFRALRLWLCWSPLLH